MTVDTLSLARELRAARLEGPQAEAIASAIGRAVMETLATKSDLSVLRSELGQDINALRADFGTLRAELKSDLEGSRSSMLLWFIGTQIAVGALIVALIKL